MDASHGIFLRQFLTRIRELRLFPHVDPDDWTSLYRNESFLEPEDICAISCLVLDGILQSQLPRVRVEQTGQLDGIHRIRTCIHNELILEGDLDFGHISVVFRQDLTLDLCCAGNSRKKETRRTCTCSEGIELHLYAGKILGDHVTSFLCMRSKQSKILNFNHRPRTA